MSKKHETSHDWWADDEQTELLARYIAAVDALACVMGEIGRRQAEALDESEQMGDAPMLMQRKLASLLSALVEWDSTSMAFDLVAIRGYADAMLIPVQTALAVQQVKKMMAPPPELLEAIKSAFGDEPGDREGLGDMLRDAMKEEDPGQEDPDTK